MRSLIADIFSLHALESLVELLHSEAGGVLLRSALLDSLQARRKSVATKPGFFDDQSEIFSASRARAPSRQVVSNEL